MDEKEMLLEEYKLCQSTTKKIESTIWQTSAAIGIGSIAFFILFIIRAQEANWQGIILIGFLLFFVTIMWFFIAKRWWDILHTTFLRMRHIEEDLGFFQTRYIYHKDGKLELFDQISNKEHLKHLYDKKLKFHLRGVKKWLRLFPWFLLISCLEYGSCNWYFSTHQCSEIQLLYFILYIIILASPFVLLIICNILWTRIKNRERTKVVKERKEYFDP